MKDVFKFLKWWWSDIDANIKALLIAFSALASFFSGLWIFGPKFIAIIILVVLVVGICYGLYNFVRAARDRWSIFKEIQENERDRIVNRLRGRV